MKVGGAADGLGLFSGRKADGAGDDDTYAAWYMSLLTRDGDYRLPDILEHFTRRTTTR